jgi:hypothetical protein
VRADAFLQLFAERRTLGRSEVDLFTHERFAVTPTTFAQFAHRHVVEFTGTAPIRVTPI